MAVPPSAQTLVQILVLPSFPSVCLAIHQLQLSAHSWAEGWGISPGGPSIVHLDRSGELQQSFSIQCNDCHIIYIQRKVDSWKFAGKRCMERLVDQNKHGGGEGATFFDEGQAQARLRTQGGLLVPYCTVCNLW